jgi:FKBP-type peptidyl-prolyl cis-trans isomerase 2
MSEKKSKKSSKKTSKKSKTEKTVKDNSLIYVDYVAKTKEEEQIFDLTIEDVAKDEGLYKEDTRYEPVLVAVGQNWLLGAIEEELVGMKVGESKTVEVPPEKGAGTRDPQKIKSIPLLKLKKQGVVNPMKGDRVKFGNEEGIVTLVTGRKARIDFNSPLAGKTLVFDVTVRDIVTKMKDKIVAVIKRRVPALPEDKYDVSIKAGTITIELPKESRYIEGIQYAEIGIAADALKVNEKADEVKFIITYERPEKPKEE